MIAALIYLLAIGILGTVVYIYLRREQRKIIPQNKDEVYSQNETESAQRLSLPLLVGTVVASIHLAISYWFAAMSDMNQVKFTLMAPSLMILFVFNYFLLRLPEPFAQFIFIVVSSLTYGSIGSLLATDRRYMQLIGVLLIGLLICLGMFLWYGAIMASA